VATYLPLIPVIVLLVLLAVTFTGLSHYAGQATFTPQVAAENAAAVATPAPSWTDGQIVSILCIYVVGFFATAGAAGVDIASNSRNVEDVHIGGTMGILLPTVLAGNVTMLVVAGAYGAGLVSDANIQAHEYNPVKLIPDILGQKWGNVALIALAISALPGACFSSLIAANSFKTTMPRINPLISVGIGALVAIVLAVTGWVSSLIGVFLIIGASFGPVCGAMMADYFLSGRKWSGPRAGFNPAGWISWIIGFAVGAFELLRPLLLKWDWAEKHMSFINDWTIPVPPVAAFVVGFALYIALSVVGLRTRKLSMPQVAE
jgi:cytosine permease